MMNRLFFLFVIIWGVTPSLQAQYDFIDGDLVDFFQGQYGQGSTERFRNTKEIEGSPYLNEEFQKGVVYTGTNKRYDGILLRYNAFNDQIEFKNDKDQVLAVSNPESVYFIELGGDKIVYRPYILNKRMKYGFFLVLGEGDMSLFVKKTTILQQAVPSKGYQDAEPTQFVEKPDTYYLAEKGKAAKVIMNKKELPGLFPDKSKEVAAFIKKHKVKYNKPEKLIALVQYYNSL